MEFEKQSEHEEGSTSTPWDCLTLVNESHEKQLIDTEKFSRLIDSIELNDSEREEVFDHANEAWTFINPNSDRFDDESKRNVYRFQSIENNFSEDFYETNWDHSCKMIRAYANICQSFPEAVKDFNHAEVIKTILWHDAPEFLHGDIPLNQQTDDVKQIKARREAEAIEAIKTNSRLGVEAGEILEKYEARESKEAILVKILDILAGQDTFVNLLYKHMPAKSSEIESSTGLKFIEYAKYLVEDQFVRSRDVFDKWMNKFMKEYGLDDYETEMRAEDYKKIQQTLGDEYAEKTHLMLQKVEFRFDDENPVAGLVHNLEQIHGRSRDFVYGLQFDIDSPNFPKYIQQAKARGDNIFLECDLFGDTNKSK